MKKLAKKFGVGLLAGALTFLPAKRANSLENIVNGNVIETISEAPVKSGVNIKAWEYLGDRIGDFVGEAVTKDNGDFNLILDNNSSNYLKLEISKSDSSYYQAERYVDLNKDILLDIVERHEVDVYDLDGNRTNIDFMKMFDMWCRDPALGGSTQRWEEQPKWYIWTDLASQEQISMAEGIIKNDLVQFTNGFINNPYIEEGKQDDILSKASYGSIIVYWRNYGGPGEHGENLENNKIVAGTVSFNTIEPVKGTYIEELTQVLGPRTETETRYFFDDKGYLESGPQIGKVLYSRPIGSKTQDEDPEP